jgi:hypothetical protein
MVRTWRPAASGPATLTVAGTGGVQKSARRLGQTATELTEYIQERTQRDFLPVASQCYEEALQRDGSLAGSIYMKFRIIGDPHLGGVVESAEADPELGSVREPEMLDCMRDALMSLVFDAPKDGGYLDVEYPVELSPDDV